MNTTWNPSQYLRYASERTRPFADLLAHVPQGAPAVIVDLGCGPGKSTALLRDRWPQARIVGIDGSADMIEAARTANTDPQVEYRQQTIEDWLDGIEAGGERPDLIVSNAVFHWIDNHLELMPRIAEALAPGGSFAFQVAGNFLAPTHALLWEIAAEPEFAPYITTKLIDSVTPAGAYIEALAGEGWYVDAWETTYQHVLQGEDPVYEWLAGAGARPVLTSLPDGVREQFIERYRVALRQAYPATPVGTILPFRRIFAVATRVEAQGLAA
ncbi:methyltransferase domain-containing protein [Rothia nasisuis]|uniref:methyltransferase domain-containing protein n=1 Tax=Rothia nasisuis TaxID=2109647 RepID=UPI001F31DF0F|nr:methyltransferase domain-containing protein [Rothia nasisuis]